MYTNGRINSIIIVNMCVRRKAVQNSKGDLKTCLLWSPYKLKQATLSQVSGPQSLHSMCLDLC